MTTVAGTFSGTGQSSVIVGRKVDVLMNFAGTASVDIEVRMPDGDWIIVSTKTADFAGVVEFAANKAYRLNCTAFTDDVEYVMQTGPEG